MLALPAVIFVALLIAHDVDHVVADDALGGLDAGFWVFLPFQYLAVILVVALAMRRDRRAPLACAVLGFAAVVGFLGAHVLPFGPLPYWDYDLPWLSWALVFVPVGVALWLGISALRAWHRLEPHRSTPA